MTWPPRPQRCARRRNAVEVGPEAERSRELLARRRLFVETDAPSTGRRARRARRTWRSAAQVAALDPARGPQDLEAIRGEIARRHLLAKIDLVTRSCRMTRVSSGGRKRRGPSDDALSVFGSPGTPLGAGRRESACATARRCSSIANTRRRSQAWEAVRAACKGAEGGGARPTGCALQREPRRERARAEGVRRVPGPAPPGSRARGRGVARAAVSPAAKLLQGGEQGPRQGPATTP